MITPTEGVCELASSLHDGGGYIGRDGWSQLDQQRLSSDGVD